MEMRIMFGKPPVYLIQFNFPRKNLQIKKPGRNTININKSTFSCTLASRYALFENIFENWLFFVHENLENRERFMLIMMHRFKENFLRKSVMNYRDYTWINTNITWNTRDYEWQVDWLNSENSRVQNFLKNSNPWIMNSLESG